MSGVGTLLSRVRDLMVRNQRDRELSEEIDLHLDMLADEFRSQGLSDADARVRARREFGSISRVKETARELRGFPLLESLMQDAAFAVRQLRQTPSFTLAAVLTLGVGIGGTTGIFSVLDVVAFRDLSYPDSDRLVVVHEGLPRYGTFPASAADVQFWSDHMTSFERIGMVTPEFLNLTGSGEPERLQVGRVSPTVLPMLGARTRLGRLPLESESQPGADHVIVLSDAFWKRRFASDAAIIGKVIDLDDVPHQVIGVLAPDFKAPNVRHLYSIPVPDMTLNAWKPLALTPEERPAVGGYNYPAIARLTPGVSTQRAQQELDAVQKELLRAVPGKIDLFASIVPLQAQMASRSRAPLLMLLAATAAVLLIGCVNITNLLSARMLARRREIAVRAAIGAGRVRLVRQILVENIVLGLAGGLAGVLVAVATMRAITWFAPADVPRLDEVALHWRVLAFAAAVSVGAGVLIGLPSAWSLGAGDQRTWLADRSGTGGYSRRSYSALMICEIGACAACVGVALLLAASLRQLYSVDKGFTADRILTVILNLPARRYSTGTQVAGLFDGLADDIRRSPGIVEVAAATQLPLTGTGALSALSADGTTLTLTERPSADVRSVSPEYFSVVNLPLVRGRLLDAHDRERPVAVLSEQLAARGWPGEDPIGRRFRLGANPSATSFEVVGIVGDVRGMSLDRPVTPTAYVPFPQRVRGIAALMVKTSADPAAATSIVRQAIRGRDPELPAASFRTMDDVVSGSLEARRFQLNVVALFALAALLLAAIGIYGVMAYSVIQRRPELGVRLALGASPRTLLSLVIGGAVRLGLAGLAVAIPVVWLAGSAVRSFLYGVTPLDPRAAALTAAVTFGVAVAAAAVPAFRASRLEPATALRHE
jgi:putative ABC transport system permease protein